MEQNEHIGAFFRLKNTKRDGQISIFSFQFASFTASHTKLEWMNFFEHPWLSQVENLNAFKMYWSQLQSMDREPSSCHSCKCNTKSSPMPDLSNISGWTHQPPHQLSNGIQPTGSQLKRCGLETQLLAALCRARKQAAGPPRHSLGCGSNLTANQASS